MIKLETKNLSFSYTPEKIILHELNLVLEEKTTGIIGQNGAGKTTFVKLLKGLLRPSKGSILFNGEDIENKTVAELSKNIGLVFQNPNDQIFKNTVIDEVMFGPLNIGYSQSEAEGLAVQALSRVGLEEVQTVNPYDLSLSERKLISIASILAMDTEVIIFDEPTMGQDYEGKELLKKIIQEEKEKEKLILCILHDMDFAAEVFERMIVLNQGRVLLDGAARDVFSEKEILEKAFLEQPYATQIANAMDISGTYLNDKELIQTISKSR